MKSVNVVRTSLALSACIGLLTACQGQGAFHSKMFTKDEAAAFAKVKAASQPNPDTPDKAPAAKEPGAAPAQSVTPPAPAAGGQQQGGDGSAKGTDAGPTLTGGNTPPAGGTTAPTATTPPGGDASNKVITENLTADTLKAQNLINLQTIDGDAVTVVSAIDVPINGTGPDKLTLGVDAIVVLDTAQRFMFVQDTPIAFSKDGSVSPLAISLQEHMDSPNLLAAGDDAVTGRAICTDETCTVIQLRFEFKLKDKTVPVVIEERWDATANKYQLHSNVGDNPKSYQAMLASGEEPKNPPAADAPAANAPAAPAANAPAAPAANAPAAPAANAPAAPAANAPAAPAANNAPATPVAPAPVAKTNQGPELVGSIDPKAIANAVVPTPLVQGATPAAVDSSVKSTTPSPLLSTTPALTPAVPSGASPASPASTGTAGQPAAVNNAQLPAVATQAINEGPELVGGSAIAPAAKSAAPAAASSGDVDLSVEQIEQAGGIP